MKSQTRLTFLYFLAHCILDIKKILWNHCYLFQHSNTSKQEKLFRYNSLIDDIKSILTTQFERYFHEYKKIDIVNKIVYFFNDDNNKMQVKNQYLFYMNK